MDDNGEEFTETIIPSRLSNVFVAGLEPEAATAKVKAASPKRGATSRYEKKLKPPLDSQIYKLLGYKCWNMRAASYGKIEACPPCTVHRCFANQQLSHVRL